MERWWTTTQDLFEQIKRQREKKEQQQRESRREGRERVAIRIALLAALFSGLAAIFTGWQAYEAHKARIVADREESPMVRISLLQTLREGTRFAVNPQGELSVEATNLGHEMMQVKSITLFAGKRYWTIHTATEKQPTLPLQTGVAFTRRIPWDYSKYPLLARDESLPEDFLVEVETTRAVHRRPIAIPSITITSATPSY